MLKHGSKAYRILRKAGSKPVWANEGLGSTFNYLLNKEFLERKKEIREEDDFSCFMNCYYITSKGKEEVDRVEEYKAQLIHEEMFFCF